MLLFNSVGVNMYHQITVILQKSAMIRPNEY